MKTLEELKEFYTQIDGEFEGYIQMSDKKLNNIFSAKQKLPEIDFDTKGFLYEACLFDGERSITIRQINDKYYVLDKNLSEYKNKTEEFFESKANKKVKIIQVWEEKEDENCLNIQVLKPTLQLFAGFEKGESK